MPADLQRSPAPPALATGRTTAVLALGGLLLTSQLYVVLALPAAVGRTFGVAAVVTTWATTAFGLAYAAGFLLLGPLGDRFGPARAVTAALVALASATLLTGLAPTWGWFLAGRAVQGLVAAAFVPNALVVLGTRVAPAHRVVATSVLISTSFASGILAPIAAQPLEPVLGWRRLFLALGAAYAVVAVVTARRVPESGRAVAGLPVRRVYAALPGTAVRRPLTPLLLATTAVLGSFVMLYTGVQLARPALVTGPGLLVLRATALPAMLAAPFLSSALAAVRHPVRITTGFGLASLAAVAVGAAPAAARILGGGHGAVVGVGAGLFVVVGCLALIAPSMVTEIGTRAGTARQPATALYSFCLFGGASLGAPVAATLAERGLDVVAAAAAALLAVACLLAARTARAAGECRRGRSVVLRSARASGEGAGQDADALGAAHPRRTPHPTF